MSVPTSSSPAASPRRRVKYAEQPFPSSTTAHAVHSSTSVTSATTSGPSTIPTSRSGSLVNPSARTSRRKMPTPFENSRRSGGRPLRPRIYEHGSAGTVHSHTCDGLDCAMVKVMNTIEILEHICTFLAPSQVLQLQLVNKKWHSLVIHSPQLCLHLFVEPQWSHPAIKFQLLLLAIPGLEIKRGDPIHLGQWVKVRMNLAAANEVSAIMRNPIRPIPPILLPRPKYADLLITQPPLKGMHAFLLDAHGIALNGANPEDRLTTGPTAHVKISCDAGITLGFLAEVAKVMFDKHDRSLQDNGHTNKVVVFKAIVSYCVQSDAAPGMRSTTRTVTEIESWQ